VRLETLTLEEITRVWDSLERSYQLCISYEVGIVSIDSGLEAIVGPPVMIALPEYAIGAPGAP